MRLTKTTSRALAVVILLLFFGVVVALTRTNTQPKPAIEVSPFEQSQSGSTPGDSGSKFALKDFHRSEIKDGRKAWEIYATLGEYMSGTGHMRLTAPIVTLYRPSGETVELRAKSAIMEGTGSKLGTTEVDGNVLLTYKKGDEVVTLETEHAKYVGSEGKVYADGFVLIKGALFEVSGEGLVAKVDTKEATLARKVKTVLKPRTVVSKGGTKP